MSSRVRWLVVALLPTLVAAVAAAPGATQSSGGGSTVVAVSGRAFGAQAAATVETEEVLPDLSFAQIADALRTGDTSSIASALEAGGFDGSQVGAQELIDAALAPTPEVILPTGGGGPFTDSAASIALEPSGLPPLPVAELGEVSTQGALGGEGLATSSAALTNVNPGDEEGPFGDLIVVADAISVECTANLGGAAASTTILGGEVVDGGDPLAEAPEPNSVLIDDSLSVNLGSGTLELTFFAIANEQTPGDHSISVNGVRTAFTATFTPSGGAPVLLEELESTLAHAECGVVAGTVVEPTFTG